MTDEAFLPDPEGSSALPHVRPKDAATLILVRRESDGFRVLMGERHEDHVFLPGRLVFPGGRVDAGDRRLNVATALRPETQAKVALGIGPVRARALGLAAIRETFEETGLLLGTQGGPAPRTRSTPWQRFLAHGILPRLEALIFVARAITPPRRLRRFDARFFMAFEDDIGAAMPDAASGELVRLAWLTPAEARSVELTPITRRVLDELEARLADADPDRPVPFHRMGRGKPVKTLL